MRGVLLLCAPGTRESRATTALALASAAGFLSFFAYTIARPGNAAVDAAFNDGLYNVVQLLAVAGCALRLVYVRIDRAPWAFITGGLAAWATADLLFSFVYSNAPPYPSVADVFYLAYYPLCYVGLLLLVQRHIADFNRSLWLDGITAALGAAAIGAAILVETVLETTESSIPSVVTNLSYPLGDVLLLSVVVGVFALSGWRPDRVWLFLGLGFTSQVIADSLFLFQESAGTYAPGMPVDAAWPLGMLLIAFAAWLTPGPQDRHEARPWLATPTFAALAAMGVLVLDHFNRQNPLALGLAIGTLLVVLVRMWMTFGENQRIMIQMRLQAVTDALTELGNRRRLIDDLGRALRHREHSEPLIFVLFDLDGFKRYNDTFGHPAGDALLRRLGRKLADVVESSGEGAAYRLGGDEFCVLAQISADGPGRLLDDTATALFESGEGFSVTASFGAVFLPDEASEPSEALRLADERLYVHKHLAELSRNRPHEVLLQAISEREPELMAHSQVVARLALDVGRRLDLSPEELSVLTIAAELHDVGKLAIPDQILLKAGPLTDDERAFIEKHTVIGQRILAAAPALREVGRIVRASHERWDGTGYPDGLRADEIPLAARIVAACDAFQAMRSGRPYGGRLSHEAALAEIRRCGSTQFDPVVVESLVLAAEADEDLATSETTALLGEAD
jgi:two-component system cell cycle response regulator